ncbi:MAG: hypothetical protein P9L98_03830 [Candidatus Kaelpia imicola]|nr:hypothetical protein [Candidatus Kaelpia imicola]
MSKKSVIIVLFLSIFLINTSEGRRIHTSSQSQKGQIIFFQTYHFDKSDFDLIKGPIEEQIQQAQQDGIEIVFLTEYTGPSLDKVVILAQSSGVPLLNLLTEKAYETSLKNIFENGVENMTRLMATSKDGIGTGNNEYTGATFEGFDKPLMRLLAKHRILVIPEPISFKSWKDFLLCEYHHFTAQQHLISGNTTAYLYHAQECIKYESRSMPAREKELLQFLDAQIQSNMMILADMGIFYTIENQANANYSIETYQAYKPSRSPLETLVAREIAGNPASFAEKEDLMYRNIINHLAFTFLISYRPDLPAHKSAEIASTISAAWGKEVAEELMAILQTRGLLGGYASLASKIIEDSPFNAEIRATFNIL